MAYENTNVMWGCVLADDSYTLFDLLRHQVVRCHLLCHLYSPNLASCLIVAGHPDLGRNLAVHGRY